MSRSTSFIGLNARAKRFISGYAKKTKESICPRCGTCLGGEVITKNVGEIHGIAGEPVTNAQQYIHKKTGKRFEEYVQADPWSSGPVIFLALRWSKTKRAVAGTKWSEREIDDYL